MNWMAVKIDILQKNYRVCYVATCWLQQLTSFLGLETQYWAERTRPNTCSSGDHHTVPSVRLQGIQPKLCSACDQLHDFSIWHFGNFDDVLYSSILVLKRWWLPWDDRRIFYCKLTRSAYRNCRVKEAGHALIKECFELAYCLLVVGLKLSYCMGPRQ